MNSDIYIFNATILTGFSLIENGAVYIKNGIIENVYSREEFANIKPIKLAKKIDANRAYLAPALVDTHIHGMEGFSASQSTDDVLKMSKALPQYGVGSFIPTMGTVSADKTIKKIENIVNAMGREEGARILGIHLEGPFLSKEKVGGQSVHDIQEINIELMESFWQASKGKIINMTVAPELENIEILANYAKEKGIVLQAGHSNATYEQMMHACSLGITHITHFFNAVSELNHRKLGIVGAGLVLPEISCELIGDGIHVAPELIKYMTNTKPIEQLVMVTDALKATKSELPEDSLIYFDKCFRRKSDGVIVGSAITMWDAVTNFVSYGIPIQKIIKMAATNPARIMGVDDIGVIKSGYKADLIMFDRKYNLIRTIIGNKVIERKKDESDNKSRLSRLFKMGSKLRSV